MKTYREIILNGKPGLGTTAGEDPPQVCQLPERFKVIETVSGIFGAWDMDTGKQAQLCFRPLIAGDDITLISRELGRFRIE